MADDNRLFWVIMGLIFVWLLTVVWRAIAMIIKDRHKNKVKQDA